MRASLPQAADLDLIDEYLVRMFPVLVGGGSPFFALHGRRVDLELVETRTFGSGVVFVLPRATRRRRCHDAHADHLVKCADGCQANSLVRRGQPSQH